MDHVAALKLMTEVESASTKKAALSARSMLFTGFLSGALLVYATAFAFHTSNGLPQGLAALVSGLVFPTGFAIIVLLGLELATGNFAVMAIGIARGKASFSETLRNWGWVYLGNFLGSIFVGYLLVLALTASFTHGSGPLGDRIIAVAEAKTLAYQHAGAPGWLTALVKGVLCNWMVALGSVLGMSSTSSIGKIVSIWLPISIFFALSLEHSIVNMFVIPSAMMLGADISLDQWLLWNQIPVTLGNIIGGSVLTGLMLHYAHTAIKPTHT